MYWTNECSWACDRRQWALNICFNLHNFSSTAAKHVSWTFTIASLSSIFSYEYDDDDLLSTTSNEWSSGRAFLIFIGRWSMLKFRWYFPHESRIQNRIKGHTYIEFFFYRCHQLRGSSWQNDYYRYYYSIQLMCLCAKRVLSALIDVSRVPVKWCGNRPTECWTFKYFIHLFLVSTSVTAYGERKKNRILQLNRLSTAAQVNIIHSNAK